MIDAWIAARTRPGVVVLFGCVELVLPVDLATEGISVVACTEDPLLADSMRSALQTQPASVQERVRIVHAPGLPLPVASRSASTVLLGEIFEHGTRPAPLIEEAARILAVDGVALVWSRYGAREHDGHLDALYLDELLAAVQPFGIVEMDLVDGYLALVATPDSTATPLERELRGLAELALRQRDLEIIDLASTRAALAAQLEQAAKQRQQLEHVLASVRATLSAERNTKSAKAVRVVRRAARRVRGG